MTFRSIFILFATVTAASAAGAEPCDTKAIAGTWQLFPGTLGNRDTFCRIRIRASGDVDSKGCQGPSYSGVAGSIKVRADCKVSGILINNIPGVGQSTYDLEAYVSNDRSRIDGAFSIALSGSANRYPISLTRQTDLDLD
jgi:hypothetical protein